MQEVSANYNCVVIAIVISPQPNHNILGSYFPSPYGRTRYWIDGPEDGQKVQYIIMLWANLA